MTRLNSSSHVFSATLRLKTDGYGFKLLRSQDAWTDDLGMLAQSWQPYGRVGFGAQGRLEQLEEENIPPAAVEAVYDLTVDLDQGTWHYSCSSECSRIEAIMPAQTEPLREFTVLYSGKLQGRMLPYNDTTGKTCSKEDAILPGCIGGLPYIAAYARRLRAEGRAVVLADAGEYYWGGELFAADGGAAAAELALLAGYDALGVSARDLRGGLGGIQRVAEILNVPPQARSTFTFHLTWPHGGGHVVARGGWDGWSQDVPMTDEGGGRWRGAVTVPVATLPLSYKFVVDGTWTWDADQATTDDGFGGRNNVLLVVSNVTEAPKLVLSNGHSPELEGLVSSYAALEVLPGLKVGVLSVISAEAQVQLPSLKVNHIDHDLVASLQRPLQRLWEAHEPQLVLLLNSMNSDMEQQENGVSYGMDAVAEFLPRISAIAGGKVALPPFSFSGFGDVLAAHGWLSSYGGESLQRLDVTVNAVGKVVDFRYSSVPMGASTVALPADDPVLVRGHELLAAAVGGGALQDVLGHADVAFFHESDPSLMVYERATTPMMALVSWALRQQCGSCHAAVLSPDVVDSGLRAGPVTVGDLRRALPRSAYDSRVQVLEMTGAVLLEGVKEVMKDPKHFTTLQGLRVGTNNFVGFPQPLTALEVMAPSGGWEAFRRGASYRVALPRGSRPPQWDAAVVVQELGELQALVQSFIQQHSPLGAELAGPAGVVSSQAQFLSKIQSVCGGSLTRQEMWENGCWLAAGNHPEEPALLGACAVGERLAPAPGFQCVACPAGKHGVPVSRDEAFFWSVPLVLANAPMQCVNCEPGFFRNSSMVPTECSPCKQHSFAEASGVEHCTPCPANSHQLDRGRTSCACDVGAYKDPEDTTLSGSRLPCVPCDTVLRGSSTLFVASKGAEACECPAGTYESGTACTACPIGMECAGGLAGPMQQAGFWATILTSDPLEFTVFNCQSKRECPAGEPSSCAWGRRGRACGRCLADFSPATSGKCEKCGKHDWLILPLVGVILVLVMGLAVSREPDATRQRMSQVVVALTGAQLCTTIQTLTAVRALDIMWAAPVKSVLDALSLFSLELDIIGVSCFSGSFTLVGKLLLQILAYPGILAIIVVAVAISRRTPKPVSWDRVIDVNGTVLLALYLSFTLATLAPLQCSENPSGPPTMTAQPGVICWETDLHVQMLVVGVIGILMYPVALLAAVAKVTLSHTSHITSGVSLSFARRYGFIFARFRRERYYCGIIFLIRNLLVALVPVICVNLAWMQLIAMSSILLISASYQCMALPWRTMSANLLEMSLQIYLVFLLVAAAPLLQVDAIKSIHWFLFLTIILVVLTGLVVLLRAVMQRLFRRPGDVFDIFLSHHKAAAGAFCRYIKQVSVFKASGVRMFLDSDELDNLDLLMDIVRTRTKTLAVVLTPQVLQRPWCAAEIVTAHRNGVRLYTITCSGFTAPSEAWLPELVRSFPPHEVQVLSGLGVLPMATEEAYTALLSSEGVEIDRLASGQDHEAMVVAFLLDTTGRTSTRSRDSRATPSKFGSLDRIKSVLTTSMGVASMRTSRTDNALTSKPRVLIAGDGDDPEAWATCLLMRLQLRDVTQETVEVIRDAKASEQWISHALFLVVLLSEGVLRNGNFVRILITVVEVCGGGMELVTVLPDQNPFQFPSAGLLEKLANEGITGMLGLMGPSTGKRIARAFRALLTVLALPLSPQGSWSLIERQLGEVARRRLFGFPADKEKPLRSPDGLTLVMVRNSLQARPSEVQEACGVGSEMVEKLQGPDVPHGAGERPQRISCALGEDAFEDAAPSSPPGVPFEHRVGEVLQLQYPREEISTEDLLRQCL